MWFVWKLFCHPGKSNVPWVVALVVSTILSIFQQNCFFSKSSFRTTIRGIFLHSLFILHLVQHEISFPMLIFEFWKTAKDTRNQIVDYSDKPGCDALALPKKQKNKPWTRCENWVLITRFKMVHCFPENLRNTQIL